jgi:hypothetical protein
MRAWRRAVCALVALALVAVPAVSMSSDETASPAVDPSWAALSHIPELENHAGGGVNFNPPGLVYVIVHPSVYSAISSSITTYLADLAAAGYTAELHTENFANPVAVRNLLQAGYTNGLLGAVLVGNVPYAWFEMEDFFDGQSYGYTAFPIDLYMMDLDGSWTDTNMNGFFNTHTAGSGDLEPEIWIARLYSSTVTISGYNQVSLLQRYFLKNHNFRTGADRLMERSLVYVDDDWYDYADAWSAEVGYVYANYTTVKDKEVTRATDWGPRLDDNYTWLALFSHSGEQYHAMKYNSGASWSYYYNTAIDTAHPKAHFYNLFCCHAGNYTFGTNSGYIGGHYLFNPEHGLAVVASTKTGSMLNFGDFYGPLAQGASLGEAFLDWFILNGETGAGADSRAWFYGMSLLGDPTLRADVCPRASNEQPPAGGFAASLTPVISVHVTDGAQVAPGSIQLYVKGATVAQTATVIPGGYNVSWQSTALTPDEWIPCRVLASDVYGNQLDFEWGFTAPSAYNVQVQAGWNLVSSPLLFVASGLPNAMIDAGGDTQWDRLLWFDPTSPSDPWKQCNSNWSSGMCDLKSATPEKGFWMHVTTVGDGLVKVQGLVPPSTTIDLKAGWNLIGYPARDDSGYTVGNLKAATGATTVEGFNAPSEYKTAVLPDGTLMRRGQGYWVNVPADTVWTVDW